MHALFGAETALVGPSAVITEGEKTVWSAGKYVPGAKNGSSFFEWFPYVCPEPVLAKRSF
jgi:hypothetical protein